MSRRRAFTLLEILIVIAIVALLSAIVLPVFNSAREGGRRASCVSNLHQLGLATQQYVADFNGHYFPIDTTVVQRIPPSLPGCPTELPHQVAWPIILKERLHNSSIFDCPSLSTYQESDATDEGVKLWNHCLPTPRKKGGGGGGGGFPPECPPFPPMPINATSYSYNVMLAHPIAWQHTPDFVPGDGFAHSGTKSSACPLPAGPVGETRAYFVPLAPLSGVRVVDPMNTILLAETEDDHDPSKSAPSVTIFDDKGLDYVDVRLLSEGKPRLESPYRLAKRHNGGYNVLFADNHVKWVKYGESKPSQWTVKKD